jgi:hypothetical protein
MHFIDIYLKEMDFVSKILALNPVVLHFRIVMFPTTCNRRKLVGYRFINSIIQVNVSFSEVLGFWTLSIIWNSK